MSGQQLNIKKRLIRNIKIISSDVNLAKKIPPIKWVSGERVSLQTIVQTRGCCFLLGQHVLLISNNKLCQTGQHGVKHL